MKVPYEKIDDEYVQTCIESHLDPDRGAPFWLEEAERYGGVNKARKDINDLEDLRKIFGLHEADRRERFVKTLQYGSYKETLPKDSQDDVYIVGESGGTTGNPKRAAFTQEDWEDMIDKTNYIFDEVGFPKEGKDWLWVGPPHPPHGIGAFPKDLCDSRNGNIFGIDLDPRILKKYGINRMEEALGMYQQHIGEQIKSIFKSQDIGVLFTTSKILEILPKNMDVSRLGLEGIFQGGTPLSQETHRLFREEIYEGIPFAGGYGAGYTGIHAVQAPETENYEVVYVPAQPTHNMEVVDENGEPVDYGERGRVTTSKVTPDFLMPAFLEEVEGTLVRPPESLENVDWPCVKDIAPIKEREEKEKGGVY